MWNEQGASREATLTVCAYVCVCVMQCSPPVVMQSPAAASPVSGGHRWSAECLQCPLVKRWVDPIRTAALPHQALLLCCWQLATHMLYQLRRNGPKLLPTPMSQKSSLHAIMLGGITVKHVHLSQVCLSHANLGSTNWVTTPLDAHAFTCLWYQTFKEHNFHRLIFSKILLNTFL